MDELLRAPSPGGPLFNPPVTPASEEASRKSRGFSRFLAAAEATTDRLRRQGTRVFHRRLSARSGHPVLEPLPFLAIAAAVGVAAVVNTVYVPAYAVTVDGVQLGTVTSPQIFERVMDRVESRAAAILGHEYVIDSKVSYEPALIRRDAASPISGFETYLFDHIDEVVKGYVLTVNGSPVSVSSDRTALDQILDSIKAPYITANTVSTEFVNTVDVSLGYASAAILQDPAKISEYLTQNVNGETTYEVAKGDTFSGIAETADMTMAELKELNPDVDVDRLSIGQILNVKETIPFLSVRTVDSVTYTEAIDCPVQEVENNTMYQGERKVLDAGVPGEASIQADITYVNGKEEERVVNSTTVLSEPTTKVVAIGTKVRPSWYPNGYFLWPVSGNITSYFGYRTIFGSYSYHSGLDIATSYGSSIRAADGGTVTFSGYMGTYGKLVIVDHGNGYKTYYGHCSSLLASVGDKVYQGEVIAKVGSTGRATGNHCHFEIRVNGTPVNPLRYLP